MKHSRRKFTAGALLMTGSLPLAAHGRDETKQDSPRTLVLRGRVVCYTEEFARRNEIKPECEPSRPLWGLKTADNQLWSFLPTDTAAAIYDDERFRTRELQVTARHFPGTTWLEVIRLQSVRAGVVYDLFYFCDVCNIRSHKPGPCDCCQDPVVFHEEPAETDPPANQ